MDDEIELANKTVRATSGTSRLRMDDDDDDDDESEDDEPIELEPDKKKSVVAETNDPRRINQDPTRRRVRTHTPDGHQTTRSRAVKTGGGAGHGTGRLRR